MCLKRRIGPAEKIPDGCNCRKVAMSNAGFGTFKIGRCAIACHAISSRRQMRRDLSRAALGCDTCVRICSGTSGKES